MRRLALALILALPLAGCPGRPPAPPPLTLQEPAATPGLEKVYGDWEADKPTKLRAQPASTAAVVGSLRPGEGIVVLGRAPGSDWFALSTHTGTTAWVRMDLLRLRQGRTTPTGTTSVMARPVDQSGPKIQAAPRSKIDAAPLAAPVAAPVAPAATP
jgi:hypothetical protein